MTTTQVNGTTITVVEQYHETYGFSWHVRLHREGEHDVFTGLGKEFTEAEARAVANRCWRAAHRMTDLVAIRTEARNAR